MLLVISPAKTLDLATNESIATYTQPDFIEDSELLIAELRKLSPFDIANLMGVSDQIAQLNLSRFECWTLPFTPDNAKQSVLTFKGDVYTGLDAESLTLDDFAFTQKHLRILSGLYGVLKPLDLMQPYRLEMGVKLANCRGKNLYEFWGSRITAKLNQEITAQGASVLVNLASNEYFKAVQKNKLNVPVVTPVFKDWKNDKYKIISFYAKKARGLMCRYVIDQKISDVDDLKSFDYANYSFNQDMSSADEWIFTRRITSSANNE